MRSAVLALARMVLYGAWSQNRGRLALSILAIALGVALGAAVHLINYSAAHEFQAAVRALSGDADIRVSGPRSGFDEALYPQLATRNEVAVASPVVEIDAKLLRPAGSVRVLGIDAFRALQLQPALLGESSEHLLELLQPGTVLLSNAAARQLQLAPGDRMEAQVGLRSVALRVLDVLPVSETLRQPMMVMDIASAQWAFEQLGRISRVELRLRPGSDVGTALSRLRQTLPAGVVAVQAQQAASQGLALSRAYRVNLNMLALVSLFTGAVLVFSTQTLSVLRRRSHFALLRALGVSARTVTLLLSVEAAVFGIAGTVVGLALGVLAAQLTIAYAGADLGAGYFSTMLTRTALDVPGLVVVGCCGVLASLLGGIAPALEAGRAQPAQALRAGDEQRVIERTPRSLLGVTVLLAAALLSLLPPINALPLFGYASIACVLIGGLLVMPIYLRWALAALPNPGPAVGWLALRQLRGTPGYAGVSLAAVLASFSLGVAMMVMIHSFRGSLETWLDDVLPADLYVRGGAAASAWIDAAAQERIRAAAPVARVAFARFESIAYDSERPPVTLIARDLDPTHPEALPLVAPQRLPAPGVTPVWISEAMRDLYSLQVGDALQIPLAGRSVPVSIAGVWRDYVRQSGTLLVPRESFVRLTGDERANEAWVWLRAGRESNSAAQTLRATLGADAELEIREPGLLRRLSLAAFDRTFAVTYALQLAAIVIGLFGISVGTSAQALARKQEFGVLYHLGLSRTALSATLAIEGALVGALGAVAGYVVGGAMSLVLIHVINRQSFHWSMDMHVPWLGLAALGLTLALCAALTSVLSARRALGDDIVRAVKEDW